MSKFKPYGKREENALLKIPAGSGNSKALREFAQKYGRTEGSAYQKHKVLHEKKLGITPGPSNAPTAVTPMTFKDVEFDHTHMRVDAVEEEAMKKGLDQAISGPLANPKRAILFPTRLVSRAKKYFADKYAQHALSFHTYKKDKKFMLLSKKN